MNKFLWMVVDYSWIKKGKVETYSWWSNRLQMGHWFSNIFHSFLEVQILVVNFLCLQKWFYDDQRKKRKRRKRFVDPEMPILKVRGQLPPQVNVDQTLDSLNSSPQRCTHTKKIFTITICNYLKHNIIAHIT